MHDITQDADRRQNHGRHRGPERRNWLNYKTCKTCKTSTLSVITLTALQFLKSLRKVILTRVGWWALGVSDTLDSSQLGWDSQSSADWLFGKLCDNSACGTSWFSFSTTCACGNWETGYFCHNSTPLTTASPASVLSSCGEYTASTCSSVESLCSPESKDMCLHASMGRCTETSIIAHW